MTAQPRESVLRLLRQATMPELLAYVGPFILLAAGQVWWSWHSEDHSLAALAAPFRMLIMLLGNVLMITSFVAAPDKRPKWAQRLIARWPAIAGQPREAPTDTGPGAIAVAQPILSGVGAACLGFAFGLNLIVAFSHGRQRHEPGPLTLLLGFVMALSMIAALRRVTGVTRRLYTWSEEAAASAATAEANADRARIAALQAQMNPHFLFNALNTVASLLGTDSAGAQRTVRNLSGMLTHTLQRSAQPLTTVEDEVQFVRDYLDIERERFGSRLQVTYAIDPETVAMTVPTMSLQPIVENAIKHAIASRIEGGHIRISAHARDEGPGLQLTVEDDGPGFAPGSEDGTGLANLRARLRSLYGSSALLTTESLPSGARVGFTIPHHARPDR